MHDIESVKDLSLEQKQVIFELWNHEYPSQLKFNALNDLENYLIQLKEAQHYFVQLNGSFAWAFSFERENEIWLAMIVDAALQGKNLGSLLLNKLKQHHSVLNAWVIDHSSYFKSDGTPYPSPMQFYLKNDFRFINNIRLEIPSLSAAKMVWCEDFND